MGTFPGGPSPDSALPSHSDQIDTRHQAAASAIDTETHRHHQEMASQQQHERLSANGPQPITRGLTPNFPPQPSEYLATGTNDTFPRNPFSDEHAAIAPDVRVAASDTEATAEVSPSLGKEAKRSTSGASRRTDRRLAANYVGEGASAASAANGPPDVDPNLQRRTTSVGDEQRQKATIGKEGRTFFFVFKRLLPSRPFMSTKLLTPILDTRRWRRPKDIENRKAWGQGRENHSAHRAPRPSRGPEAARGVPQGKPLFVQTRSCIPFSIFKLLVMVT